MKSVDGIVLPEKEAGSGSCSILFVEDFDTDFSLLSRAVRRRLPECEIVRAITHAEVVTLLSQRRFDVYVVDMNLPDASGAASIRNIRAHDDAVPILALTGTGSIEKAVAAVQAGANSFFEKSVPTFAVIAEHLSKIVTAASDDRSSGKTIAELEAMKTRFQDYAEAASDWFWEKDENLRYTYLSSGVERTTGMSPAEMTGRTIWEVFSGADLKSILDHERDVKEHRLFRDYVCDVSHPDGSVHTIRISGKPILDEHGQFKGYRGVGRDISEQVVSQKKLEAALLAAEKAYRAQSQFLAVMSHELRTPLNAIIGFSDVLAMGMFKDDAQRIQECLGNIGMAGRQLLSLVNDILDLSQLKGDGRKMTFEDLDLSIAVREAVSVVTPLAEKLGIAIVNGCQEIGRTVRADDRSLHQIIQNVLVNAIKFSRGGGSVAIYSGVEKEFIKVSIQDTGIGMTEETIRRVTEPFFQAEDAMSRKVEGSGLGLAIVTELVRTQNGVLNISSEHGKGTRVDISIPRADVADSWGSACH
jgi:PAS domain S-box-containing protein